MGNMADAAESGTLDRRSLIKKAALAGGAAWVAPVVLSSRAGASTQTCYFVKISQATGNCSGQATPSGACSDRRDTENGCGDTRLTMSDVTPEGASATVVSPCRILEMWVASRDECNLVDFSGGSVTDASVTRADSPGGDKISSVAVVFCCPDRGSV